MNSEPCRRVKSSCRTDKSTGRITPEIDFTLYGSPAPRCSQRATPVKRPPSQPPNTPNRTLKPRKPLKLPIEKIILLSEKMECSRKEKIKLELSSRQIKLLSDREDDHPCPDTAKTYSSAVDLSIDLSTVTNSDHESDTNSDEPEEFVPQLPLSKKKACSVSSTDTESPSRYVWRLDNGKDNFPQASERSSLTEYPCSAATKKSDPTVTDRSHPSPKCFRSRSADLIHLYVSTVNQKDNLTKYFRPCHVCNNACCICPDLVPESSRSFPIFNKPQFNTIDKMVETDPTITAFEPGTIPAAPDSDSDSSNSEFSNFLVERYLNKTGDGYEIRRNEDTVFDSGNSTLQLDELDGSGRINRKKNLPLSVIQLATAAQCARILANSLESVLEIVEGDSEECGDLVRFKGDDLNQLFESLLSLKSHFAESETIAVEQQKEWVDFEDVPESDSQNLKTDSDAAFPAVVSTGTTTDFHFEDNFEEKLLSCLQTN